MLLYTEMLYQSVKAPTKVARNKYNVVVTPKTAPKTADHCPKNSEYPRCRDGAW